MKIKVIKPNLSAPELTQVYFNDIPVNNSIPWLNPLHPTNILTSIYLAENPIQVIRKKLKFTNKQDEIRYVLLNDYKLYKICNMVSNVKALKKWLIKNNVKVTHVFDKSSYNDYMEAIK